MDVGGLGAAARLFSPDLRTVRGPYVMLDDARDEGAFLFRHPVQTLVARSARDVAAVLGQARLALDQGCFVAGYLSYEAGLALEPATVGFGADRDGDPLVWLGVFSGVERLESALIGRTQGGIPPPARFRPCWSFERYARAVERSIDLIAAGDIYQVNLTFRAEVELDDPLDCYALWRERQRAGWGGIVATEERTVLSFSPELYFTTQNGQITARPMKGTQARSRGLAQDRRLAAMLGSSVKDRAENLMIVDLLRNDISRVARAGSVQVPALFEVETYPTLHQMTSTITAQLDEGRDAIDLLLASFPCGSITGAPKIRAMEVIEDLEDEPRGIYTGAIGFLGPGGVSAFNVAIRSFDLPMGRRKALLGLGSAIVADSRPADEWRECLLKGRFIGSPCL